MHEVRQTTATNMQSLGHIPCQELELLSKHVKSKWHLAAIEALAMSESAKQHGDIVDKMLAASEIERQQNHELLKKLIRSLYFLVRHCIPHTTPFRASLSFNSTMTMTN